MLFMPATFYVLGDKKFSCCYQKYLKRFWFFFPSIVRKDMINPFHKPLKKT